MISYGILPILPVNCTKLAKKIATTKKLSNNVEKPHLPEFSGKCHKYKIKMVIENRELVREKSWKNTLSSLWEPGTMSSSLQQVAFLSLHMHYCYNLTHKCVMF